MLGSLTSYLPLTTSLASDAWTLAISTLMNRQPHTQGQHNDNYTPILAQLSYPCRKWWRSLNSSSERKGQRSTHWGKHQTQPPCTLFIYAKSDVGEYFFQQYYYIIYSKPSNATVPISLEQSNLSACITSPIIIPPRGTITWAWNTYILCIIMRFGNLQPPLW